MKIKENSIILNDKNITYHNKDQKEEVKRVCILLNDKGYKFNLVNNFLNNGVVIVIKENIQIKGEIIIFKNGNWIKDIYLKNKKLYYNGYIKINEELLKLSNGKTFLITGELPISI